MPITIIDRAFDDNAALRVYLSDRNEISLLRTVDDSFRKTLVLSAASLFEHQITDAIHGYCDRKSSSDACVLALVRIKAIKRQYFTYFEWEQRRAGPFFSLLGDVIGEKLKAECKTDPLKSSLDAFWKLAFFVTIWFTKILLDMSLKRPTKKFTRFTRAHRVLLIEFSRS